MSALSPLDKKIRIANRCAMSSLAERMSELRRTDRVAYADMVTSMNDRRAGLSLSIGTPLDEIDRNGYRVRTTLFDTKDVT